MSNITLKSSLRSTVGSLGMSMGGGGGEQLHITLEYTFNYSMVCFKQYNAVNGWSMVICNIYHQSEHQRPWPPAGRQCRESPLVRGEALS